MARTPILNANRIVIGYIEEQGGGKQKALDRNAMLLGYYDPSTNSMLNANRVLVGKGNQLAALIAQAR
ncbi:hypothetical protein [Sphingomonas carotinifaciens]|uniref:hypothetical protein n=1 Tax=Sphingomonas carotinifaciens TaxID=1166323 RepID=UPI000DD664B0|nr:hypothetical protein [Sphingomonas carotinifaciens]